MYFKVRKEMTSSITSQIVEYRQIQLSRTILLRYQSINKNNAANKQKCFIPSLINWPYERNYREDPWAHFELCS